MKEVLHKLKLLTALLVVIACSLSIYGFKTGYDALFREAPKEETRAYLMCGNASRGSSVQHRLYQDHCASCHIRGRSMIGPNLERVMDRVSPDWFYTLLNNPDSLRQIQDPYFNSLMQKWEPKSGSHPVIQLSRAQVNELIEYVD